MTAETASKLAKVQRYSASLKRLFQVLLVAVALAMCAKVFLIAIGDEVSATFASGSRSIAVSPYPGRPT